jgi:hypothetical protein
MKNRRMEFVILSAAKDLRNPANDTDPSEYLRMTMARN